ncbi:MAG TPA: hypothetical protein VK828_19045 [Terriglobales bacterium]|nr:hypothetical protein [Terriglobales bacterium]
MGIQMGRTGADGKRKHRGLFPEGLIYDQKHLFLNHFNPLLVIDFKRPINPQYIIDDDENLIGVPDGI